MALDRQSIEKKDFPVGHRGYDPDAVDAHLSALAEEIEEFKRASRRRSDALASSASEQVRAIVDAAERSAAEIQREAEAEAREIRGEAENEARAIRDQASGYVGKVSESTGGMLERIDAMEGELGALIEALRTGGNRLDSDLRQLEGSLKDTGATIMPRSHEFTADQPEPEPEPAEPASADPDFYDPDAPDPDGADYSGVASAAVSEPGPGASGGPPSEDAEGARLIALNMALNGTPRDETARYLSENFELADSDGLLDEVYASVEG